MLNVHQRLLLGTRVFFRNAKKSGELTQGTVAAVKMRVAKDDLERRYECLYTIYYLAHDKAEKLSEVTLPDSEVLSEKQAWYCEGKMPVCLNFLQGGGHE
jgi:hypothetical protein